MLRPHKIIKLLAFLLIGVTYLSTVNYFVPESLIYLVLPLIVVLSYPRVLMHKSMIIFFVFILFIIFDQLVNKNPIMTRFATIISYVTIFIWAALAFYLQTKQKDYFKLIKFTLLFSFITVLISLFWTMLIPDVVRATVSKDNQDLSTMYSKLGLMSYGFAHALPLLFPIIIFMAKNENKKKKILLIGAVIISLFFTF